MLSDTEIIGVAHGRNDVQAGADERAGHFGDKFFAGVASRAEAVREVAREALGMAGPVRQFVKRGPVIIDLRTEGRLRRNPDEILRRDIERLVAADADIGAGGGDERFGARDDLAFRHGRRIACDLAAQPFALIDVEDGEAFEEGDAFRLAAFAGGALKRGLRREAVGEQRHGSALALPDHAARLAALIKGEPALARISALDGGAPQKQDVDARIAAPRHGVARQSQTRRAGRFPWGRPKDNAPFKIGDDGARHLIIKGRARRSRLRLAHRLV